MVIEDTECTAHHGLRIAVYVPGEPETRRPIVFVTRKALPDVHCILGSLHITRRKRDSGQGITEPDRSNQISDLVVIPDAIVERHIRPDLPRVLPEESKRFIFYAANRVPESLNEICRKTQSILLYRREVRRRRQSGSRAERRNGRTG